MFKEAALGICVMSQEGAAVETLLSADMVVPNIFAAFSWEHPTALTHLPPYSYHIPPYSILLSKYSKYWVVYVLKSANNGLGMHSTRIYADSI